MNKKLIRLTESDLHKIVKKSVKTAMKESLKKGKDNTWIPVNDTEPTAEDNFCEYAERYGLDAFGYAIYNMIKDGDMEVNFDMANDLWEYGGNVKELY